MPIFRAQVAIWHDSILPRDACVINPVFNDVGGAGDAQSLADDLATAIKNWWGGLNQIRVRMYDVQGTPPVYAAGEKLLQPNVAGAAPMPRELAICLSFYHEHNAPRLRGRLYVPLHWTSGGEQAQNRPSASARAKVAALAPIFADLGGVNVDWSVWSERDGQARAVTDWYVDDEWDVVRSRGLRPTNRIVGTTSEESLMMSAPLADDELVAETIE